MTVPKETEVDITRLHYGEHWRVGTIAAQLGIRCCSSTGSTAASFAS